MADEVRFRVTADDDEAIRAMNNVIRQVQRGEDSFQDLSRTADRSFDQVARSAAQANGVIQNTSQSIGQFGATIDRNTKQINLNSRAAGNLAFQLQDVFVQLGSGQGILRTFIQQGPQITSIFGGVGNTFRFLGQQVKNSVRELVTFRRRSISARRAAAGVGVALTALVAIPLGAYLAKNGDLASRFDRAMQGLAATVGVVVDRTANLGEALVNLFQGGGFQRFATEFTLAFRGIGDEIADARKNAVDLTRELQELQAASNELTLFGIGRGAEADRLRTLAEDENTSIRQRIGLLREAQNIEGQNRAAQVAVLTQQLTLQRQRGDSQDELFKVEKEIAELQAETSTAEVQNRQEINALIQESINRTRELTATLGEASATLGGPAEVARFQYERALEAIQRLKEEAQLIGLELDFGPLETLAQEELKRAVDAARGELEELPPIAADQVEQLTDELGRAGEAAALKLSQGLEAGTLKAQPILENIRDQIQSAFDIKDNQLNTIVANFGTAYGSITDAVTAETERQITAQELVIDAIRERVDETTRLLEQEQRKAAQGYANNVSAYEKQLAEQLEAQEQAEQKRLDLERKASRQRLIINSAEQVSNYILAITKLTAAEAGKGIVGVATTIAGVALIASIIARARAQAAEFQELPRFREGTPYLDGPGTGKSDSITARLSKGERVVPAEYNAMLGGRAVSNEELVRTFKIGQLTEQRFEFNRPDFADALRRVQADQQRIAQAQEERRFRVMQEAYERAADQSAERMIEYWRTRPIEWIDDDGARVVERHEGNVIRRKRIKDV